MEIYFSIGSTNGTVDNPCIETKIKKLYNKKLSELLKKKNITDNDSEELNLLKQALEIFDFPSLRLQCEINKIESKNMVLIKRKKDELVVKINNITIIEDIYINDKR